MQATSFQHTRLPVCQAYQEAVDRRLSELESAEEEDRKKQETVTERSLVTDTRVDHLETWQKRQNGTLQDIQKDNKDTQLEIRKLREELTRIMAIGGTVFFIITTLADKLWK